MARKNPLPENERCRGRHSKCGGANPAKSAKWHLCDNGPKSCTALYKAMKKAEAAAKPKATPAKAATKVTPLVSRKPPAPKREPVARVPAAAMIAPEVSVTKG